MLYLVWVVIMGIVVGALAGIITRGRGFGLLGDLVVGVIGSLVGGFVFGLIGLGGFGLIGRLVAAVIGAVILLWLIPLIKQA